MKPKFTPGPWIYDDIYGLILAKTNGAEIAACHSGIEANARLIAAAPEMLAALEWLYPILKARSENAPDSLKKIKDLIAKARGE